MELIRLNVLFAVFCLVFNSQAFANLDSPFLSEVEGLNIRNAHIVSQHPGASIIRGQAPKVNEIDELAQIGVERVLIFKNQTQGEVTKEISDLKRKGFRAKDLLQVDMPWKDISNFQDVCEMTIQSLQFLEESVQQRKTVFFHCTVGEDRTGYLAGLWGLWSGEFKNINQAFNQEMCAKGYEAGNSKKPALVVRAVRENLTPTFLKMVQLLADARLKNQPLKQIKCPSHIPLTKPIPTCH